MSKTIKVIVDEGDYEETFYANPYNPEYDDLDDTVEVDEAIYDELVVLAARLIELEDYFLSFKSKNEKDWDDEWAAAHAKEEAHRKKCHDAIMADPGYTKAQEKLSNATNTK